MTDIGQVERSKQNRGLYCLPNGWDMTSLMPVISEIPSETKASSSKKSSEATFRLLKFMDGKFPDIDKLLL